MCECEYLFCFKLAQLRVTVPHIKPRVLVCEEHACELLDRAAPYRKVLGAVSVERLP